MRVEQVTVTGFGPISERTLDLTAGLTVVVGGNESAKSSWHAATYAALCGIRRGKGQAHERDREFRDRHKPWDGGPWRVGARLVLDDGRVVELSQELDDRVDCRAIEVPIGRDVSNEVMNDGTVDASVWLGLGRRAFAATACIRQADLLAVREAGGELHELLGRAAATGGADESTARALARLAAFQRDQVGTDRVNAVKPWRRAIEAEAQARQAVDAARETRAEFDRRAVEVNRLQDEADVLARAARLGRAARLRSDAAGLGDRAARAADLAAELGPTRPAGVADEHESVGVVTAALSTWRSRPAIPEPGADPEAVRAELDALPAPPEHDTAVAPSVATSHGTYTAAVAASRAHDALPDARPVEAPTGPTADDLRDLAAYVEALGPEPAAPAPPPAVAAPSRSRWPWTLVGLGVVVAVVGAVGSQVAVAVAGAVIGLVGLVLALRRPPTPPTPAAPADPRPAWQARWAELVARAAAYGVAADGPSIRAAADEVAGRQTAADAHGRWQVRRAELVRDVERAAAGLRGALGAREAAALPAEADLDAAYAAYERACQAAHEVAVRAARRPELVARLSQAEQAAAQRSAAVAATDWAWGALRDAATAVGVDGANGGGSASGDGDVLAAALEEWLDAQRRAARGRQQLEERWSELDRLLGDGDLDALRARARSALDAAAKAAEGLAVADLDGVTPPDDAALAELGRQAAEAREQAAAEDGRLREFARALPDVSVLDERWAAARAELDRVEGLKVVLERTVEFMSAAQERVHRDIAPRLQASLVRWLPVITQGRYVDATVDPATLDVRVCGVGRRWRKADLLSFGTAEQIYLLLRLALVEHLTAGRDTCPLLLDDVTVHADAARTDEILELLWAVSAERQVVLFTQEDQVAAWARERLADRPGAVVELVDIPAP